MNIYALDMDPGVAARYMCDIHVRKMILEAAQLLSTAAIRMGYDAPYDPTHRHHKCVSWIMESRENWDWLVAHGHAAYHEYMARFGSTHKSYSVLLWAKRFDPDPDGFESRGLSPFADAVYPPSTMVWMTPEQGVTEYREYYARKEQVWAVRAKAYSLIRLAAGRKCTPGNKPIMKWREPGSRPEWMPDPRPEWKPDMNTQGEAEGYGLDNPGLDPRNVPEDVNDMFVFLAKYGRFPSDDELESGSCE